MKFKIGQVVLTINMNALADKKSINFHVEFPLLNGGIEIKGVYMEGITNPFVLSAEFKEGMIVDA